MTAQDRSIQQYQQLLQINAASHLIRLARDCGLFQALAAGQRTAVQLTEALEVRPTVLRLLLDALCATGVIEQYGDDYALAQVTRLLTQYDADLGDHLWRRLQLALSKETPPDLRAHHQSLAATQWIHTRAAMEAAEMLGIGGERQGCRILDWGCGSAVWSCAMAYRDQQATVTAVDHATVLGVANETAAAIELGSRFSTIQGDPAGVDLPDESFDLAILPQRLHTESLTTALQWLRRIWAALDKGGEIVVIDLFQTQSAPRLGEAIEALRLELSTPAGEVRSLQQTEQQLLEVGFKRPQFSYLPASHVNLGLLVARKE